MGHGEQMLVAYVHGLHGEIQHHHADDDKPQRP
jgi:hypothetical protein